MASKSLGQLTIDLVARTGGWVQGMDKSERATKKWRKQVEKDMNAAGKVIGTALAAGATIAATALVVVVNRQRELIDQQAKLAQRYRTTYESLSVLNRAGDLAGVTIGQIETASKGLEQRLGQAIQGTDAQKEAFDRLGLSAQAIADLPLDQRISEINKALRENVQASERAAVAGKIFGEEGAITMQALNPETIAEAARQVEIFGLNLSDVDAAKVEMANDAMSTFSMLADGAGKQLTVELAPILKAIGDLFLEGAEEAGGMGDAITEMVDSAIEGLAFVMDAGDGVGRVFQLVGKTIAVVALHMQQDVLEFADSIWNGPVEALNALIETSNRLPGINISTVGLTGTGAGIRADLAVIEGAISEGQRDIAETMNKPLAGQRFVQFVADARKAGEDAAQATVAARDAAGEMGEAYEEAGEKASKAGAVKKTAADQAAESIEREISALERAAKVWGMEADQVKLYDLAQQGATQTQLAYAESLLDTVAGLEARKQAEEDYQQLIVEDGDKIARIVESLKTEEELLAESYERRRQVVIDSVTLMESEKTDLLLELEEDRQAQMAEMEAQRTSMMLSNYGQLFDGLGGLAAQFAGEQSGIARAMFAVSKAFAVADAIVKIQQGIASAAALPFPANIPAMASVAAATGSIVSTIQGTGLTGMAHDGIDSVPKTGTWLLEKGERVMTSQTSAKIDKALDRSAVNGGGMGGGGNVFNNTFNVPERMNRQTQAQINQSQAREQGRVQARFGK